MQLISVRQNPAYKDKAIAYFQQNWSSVWPIMYEDCISQCIGARNNLPQWYLLEKDGELIGARQQERFTRIKHDQAFPNHAIDYCLTEVVSEGLTDSHVYCHKVFCVHSAFRCISGLL